jgi:hypothetical protein
LTRATTIIALTCFLVVGAAAASILGRDSVPAAGPAMASAVVQGPVSNKENKKDRLAVVAAALASFEPPPTDAIPGTSLRQAFVTGTPADVEAPKIADPRTLDPRTLDPRTLDPKTLDPKTLEVMPSAPAKPKLVGKPAPQKSYALLSDAQITGIKDRLKLSSAQESYWPAVENALRAVARKIHATRQADPNATGAPIDPDADEVQQLKSAAMPLLFQLREDQKREVRMLARLIGLEKVAAQI